MLAVAVLDTLPEPTDGMILKRDLLGVDSGSLTTLPPVSFEGMLELLASRDFGNLIGEKDVEKRFDEVSSEEIGQIATFIERHSGELSRWHAVLLDGIVRRADGRSIREGIPQAMRVHILSSRPDLIDDETLESLQNEELLELLRALSSPEIRKGIASIAVRRNFGAAANSVFYEMPSVFFAAAVKVMRRAPIADGWRDLIRRNRDLLINADVMGGITSTSELLLAFDLLGGVPDAINGSGYWVDKLATIQDDIAGADRTSLQSMLFGVALRRFDRSSWALLAIILPDLRKATIRETLSDRAYRSMDEGLPKLGHDNWDINKRILYLLHRLLQVVPDDGKTLSTLNLSPEEMDFVTRGPRDEPRRLNFFWPWWS
jgi:hypothetical protein